MLIIQRYYIISQQLNVGVLPQDEHQSQVLAVWELVVPNLECSFHHLSLPLYSDSYHTSRYAPNVTQDGTYVS